MPDGGRFVVIHRGSRYEVWERCDRCSRPIYHKLAAETDDEYQAHRIAGGLELAGVSETLDALVHDAGEAGPIVQSTPLVP